jgi:Xaa-Pro dipeptidase
MAVPGPVPVTAAPADHRAARADRLRALLERRSLGAAVLRVCSNFAWYTGGGDSRVDHANPLGVADVVITPDSEFVLASSIEAPRMRAEEARGVEVVEFPWHEGPDAVLGEIVGDVSLGADVPLAGAVDLSAGLAALRRVLDPDAVEQLTAVGADASAAIAEAAATVSPGTDERQLAAALAGACRSRGLCAHVLLVGGDERIARFRHPIPARAPIHRRALLAVSAERGGLYANVTRIVELVEPDAELARRRAACDEILARMRDEATKPGATLSDAFAACTRFYADAGYPDEWRLHHQGGPTGYVSREVIATPSTHDPIEVGQAFAWNPSITGAKSEETFLLTSDGPRVVAA